MPDPTDRPAAIVAALGLAPHPERGFFVETYRAPLAVDGLPDGRPARAASTAIYFLVTRAQPTTYLHRLRSDELFHLYEGGPLDVLLLREGGAGEVRRLGPSSWRRRHRTACSVARWRPGSTSPTSSWPPGPSWRRASPPTPRASRA